MGEGNSVSHGKARQRYRCKVCQKTFSAKAGTMFEGLRKPTSLIVIVVTLVAYGCPTQAIVHAFGLDERTVASWQQRAGKHCQQVHEAVVQQGQLPLVHVQADEIRVKGHKMIAWMGLAMMVSTRLWLGGVVQVTRDRKLADRLLSQVRACSQPLRPLLVCTDGWSAYPGSIRRAFRKISQNDCWARTGMFAGMAHCFYCDRHQAHGKNPCGRSRAANDSGDTGASPEALTAVTGRNSTQYRFYRALEWDDARTTCQPDSEMPSHGASSGRPRMRNVADRLYVQLLLASANRSSETNVSSGMEGPGGIPG